ncbi:MAG: hypothetical protein OZ921_16990 [Sorangiineae bacterium]|nr:hypothetical protein [Polyangiaceae bacterium]MEB2324212.1 hypothetical protein [Sorangiineae bacterium]
MRPGTSIDPAVLVVGADARLGAALAPALAKHRVFVETTSVDQVMGSVVAAAPDLILLVGDAAKDCGSAVLAKLSSSPLSSVVPIAILDDDAALDARLRAFRHGAAAVIPRSASVDAIATQIARLAREIPDRDGSALGDVGEATLHELLDALGKELRSGVLSVATEGGREPVRLVLGSGQPLARTIDDFVAELKRHIVVAEPLRYEFDEHAGGTVQLLGGEGEVEAEEHEELAGLRVLLADDDAARADAVAQELRARGMVVVVTDLDPTGVRFARLRQLDPSILIIGEEHVHGAGYGLLRRMRRDTRLRWPSLLVLRWSEVWADAASSSAIDRITTTLALLAEAETSIRTWADAGESFDTRLEALGPMRLVRALASTGRSLAVDIINPRIELHLDFKEELVVGATGRTLDERALALEGATALAALSLLGSGRVRIEPSERPATANLMATADVALNMADAEPAPIAPSVPAAPDSTRPVAEIPPAPRAPSLRAFEAPSLPPIEPDWERAASAPRPPAHHRRVGRRATKTLAIAGVALTALGVGALVLVRAFHAPAAGRAEPTALTPAPSARTPREAALPPSPRPSAASAPAERAEPATTTPDEVPATAPAEAPNGATLPRVAVRTALPRCDALLSGAPQRVRDEAGFRALGDANRALMRGDAPEAVRAFCTAERAEPSRFQAATGLARLALLSHDASAAEGAARRAREAKPDSTEGAMLLGDALALDGRYEDAKKLWLETRGASPSRLELDSLAQGKRSLRAGDFGRAERYYFRAIVLDPGDADAAVGLVRTTLALGDPTGARAWAEHATRIAPKSANAEVLLGDALKRAGDQTGADRAWQRALALDSANPDARRRLGLAK